MWLFKEGEKEVDEGEVDLFIFIKATQTRRYSTKIG